MQVLRLAGGLLLALVVHVVLVAVAPTMTGVVDPFLLLIVFLALDGKVRSAVLVGCVAGLTEDAMTNGLFGVYGLAGTVVGYVAARAAQLLSLERRRLVALLFGLSAVIQQIVVLVLMVALITERELPSLSAIALRIVVSGALGTLAVALATRLSHRFRVWRQERQPRVRFENRL